MQSSTGGFANSVKAGYVGLTIYVGDDTAAGVVRGGNNWRRVAGDVETELQALCVDGGEGVNNKVGRAMTNVEL